MRLATTSAGRRALGAPDAAAMLAQPLREPGAERIHLEGVIVATGMADVVLAGPALTRPLFSPTMRLASHPQRPAVLPQ
jgi:hypothetical protein